MFDIRNYEQPVVLPIKEIREDAKDFRTFVFEYDLQAIIGQFVMVWLPGVDAKPMAVAHQTESEFHISALMVGPFTKKLGELKVGDKVGILGPYGKSFTLQGKRIVTVGGGSGTPPMKWLAYEAAQQGIEVDFVYGARNNEYLPYKEELEKAPFTIHATTDDGSFGAKGFTTDTLAQLMKEHTYDAIYTCGPEIMMKKVIDLANEYNVPCEVSMERYMKCGFGICGQCCVDGTGEPVCTKGPVFSKEYVEKIEEFLKYHRDARGDKHYYGGENIHKRD